MTGSIQHCRSSTSRWLRAHTVRASWIRKHDSFVFSVSLPQPLAYTELTAAEPPSRARLALPQWLWGGKPAKLLTEARYRSQQDGVFYLVQPEEAYLHRSLKLIRSKTVHGPGSTGPDLGALARLKEPIEPPYPLTLSAEVEKRRLRAARTDALVDILNLERINLQIAPVHDLPAQAVHLLRELQKRSTNQSRFNSIGIHVIEVDTALLYRMTLAPTLLRVEQDARLERGDLSQVVKSQNTERIFASGAGLHDGLFLFDAYLEPLLAALVPGVWAFSVLRTSGPLVISLGHCLPGVESDAAELLQLIDAQVPSEGTPLAELPTGAAHAAVTWWVERLNQLFEVLTDVRIFADVADNYVPTNQFEALLTVEQIFRRTASMQMAQRDSGARRTLFFSALDSIEGLNSWDLTKMCTLRHAESVLARLEDVIPQSEGSILLPMARRAVEALRRVQDGLFLRHQLQTDGVELRLPENQSKVLRVEDAAAQYLKILRDATHDHGGRGKSATRTGGAILVHHNGDIPHDIGWLAYLYLLDLLVEPERLRRCLHRPGR